MSTAVCLENISLRFGAKRFGAGRFDTSVTALDQVSCTFKPGGFTALVGPSGCGKSTLLRVIAGLQTPDSGVVRRNRHDNIGFVFQDPTLLAWRNVQDNVAIPLKIKGLNRHEVETCTAHALELVGLDTRRDALPRELSGGMKMRVSLARALAGRPQLLLLDEPFAALDELTRFRLDDDLRNIWQQTRCTIIFVTHAVTEAAYLAERALVMRVTGQLGQEITIVPRAGDATAKPFRETQAYQTACRDLTSALGHYRGHDMSHDKNQKRGKT